MSAVRKLQPGEVLLWTPGLDSKLTDTWQDPYIFQRKLLPINYMID